MPIDSIFYGYDLGGADTEPKEENNEPKGKTKEKVHGRVQDKASHEADGGQEERHITDDKVAG